VIAKILEILIDLVILFFIVVFLSGAVYAVDQVLTWFGHGDVIPDELGALALATLDVAKGVILTVVGWLEKL